MVLRRWWMVRSCGVGGLRVLETLYNPVRDGESLVTVGTPYAADVHLHKTHDVARLLADARLPESCVWKGIPE